MSDTQENVLPRQVRDAVKRADSIISEVYKAEDAEADTEAKDTEAKDTEAEAKETAPTAEAAEPAPPPAAEENFEHKFKVLQGKYSAEVPRLHEKVRGQVDHIKGLERKITDLEATVASLRETQKAPKTPDPQELTPEEIDQFGPDLVDVIDRVAAKRAKEIVAASVAPIQQSVKQVGETVASTRKDMALSKREKMLTSLAEAVPDWEKQNVDPDFLDWLDLADPYEGEPRAKLLAEAYAAGDAKRVISFFTGFRKENAVVTSSNQSEQTETPEGKKPEQPQPLNDLVAPGSPKTGSTGAQTESGKKIWTQADIREFTIKKNEFIKKYPERDLPEELQKLDRDLFRAQTEERIKF